MSPLFRVRQSLDFSDPVGNEGFKIATLVSYPVEDIRRVRPVDSFVYFDRPEYGIC